MKICRFCNHEQESGNYCDACGSPFSADKVVFSDSASDSLDGFGEFPDPTKSTFPDPTQQAFPDPTVSSSSSLSDFSTEKKEQPAQEHVAGAAVAAFGTKDTPEKTMTSPEELMSKGSPKQTESGTDVSGTKTQDKGSEVSGTKAQDKGDNVFGSQFPDPTLNAKKEDSKPKVMYSAAARGETVYAKSKGGLGTEFTPVQPGPGWWNGAPNANAASNNPKANAGVNTPHASQPANNQTDGQTTAPAASQNTTTQQQESIPVYNAGTQSPGVGTNPAFKPYEDLYNHVLVSFGLSLLGLVCCCGMTILATIFSTIAYGKINALKKGTSLQSADEVIPKVKKFVLISDILLGVSFVLMAIAVISNAAS